MSLGNYNSLYHLPIKLKVVRYFSNKHIGQLVRFSNHDQNIVKFTSDRTRFSNFGKVSEWISGDISVHILTDTEEDALLGLIWFRPKPLDWPAPFDVHSNSASVTLAKRTYPPARGQGMIVPFFREAVQQYLGSEDHGPSIGFWLSTRTQNTRNIAVNRKLGFKIVGTHMDDTFMLSTAGDMMNALKITK